MKILINFLIITGLGEKFTWKKKVLYRGEFIDGEKSDKGEENSNE